jgi:hypothetical protein
MYLGSNGFVILIAYFHCILTTKEALQFKCVGLQLGCPIFFFFLAVLGFEFRALRLLGRHSTLEPCLQPFLLLIVFQVGFSVFAWLAWDWELPTYVSHVAEVTDIYHHALLIC